MKLLLNIIAVLIVYSPVLTVQAEVAGHVLFADDFKYKTKGKWQKNKHARVHSDVSDLKFINDKAGENHGISIDISKRIGSSVSWVSHRFSLKNSEYLDANVVVSTDGLIGGKKTWHKAAITIQFFNVSDKYIGHSDIVRIAGTHTDEKFSSMITVPESALYARVIFSAIKSIGTVTLHSISIHTNKNEPLNLQVDNGVMPRPWIMKCESDSHSIDALRLRFAKNISRDFKVSVLDVLQQNVGTNRAVLYSDDFNVDFNLITKDEIELKRKSLRDEDILELLKPDGYSLSINKIKGKLIVNAESASERGLFYSAQTLLQLLDVNISSLQIKSCDIRDWPVLSTRGIASGRSGEKYLKNLSKYKISDMQISGAPGFWKGWNKPVNAKLVSRINKFGKNLKDNYINGTVMSWPGAYGDVFTWSSEYNRQQIVDKAILYGEAGFSSVLLVCASDYARVGRGDGIVSRQDVVSGISLAEAHLGMIKDLHNGLRNKNLPMSVDVFPYYYMGAREYSSKELGYLKQLSTLDDDISLYYGGRLSDRDVRTVRRYFNRKPTIRISAPRNVNPGSKALGVRTEYMLKDRFDGINSSQFKSIIVEAPADDADIPYIADFLWNYGRDI